MSNIIPYLEKQFKAYSNQEIAQKQKAYLRDQFEFFGIPKPVRASVEKEIIKKFVCKSEAELIDVICNLWQQNKREFHYAAINIAVAHKKLWTQEILPTFEYMIRTHSWWDTVDTIAAHLVGGLLKKYPELMLTMDIWIADNNLWISRTAIIFQLRWKQDTQEKLLFKYCTQVAHEKDFFIRKAIGWALREYSKTNPESVRSYIQKNRSILSNLSVKEGSKYI